MNTVIVYAVIVVLNVQDWNIELIYSILYNIRRIQICCFSSSWSLHYVVLLNIDDSLCTVLPLGARTNVVFSHFSVAQVCSPSNLRSKRVLQQTSPTLHWHVSVFIPSSASPSFTLETLTACAECPWSKKGTSRRSTWLTSALWDLMLSTEWPASTLKSSKTQCKKTCSPSSVLWLVCARVMSLQTSLWL